MAGKPTYRYHSYSGARRGSDASDGLFGWTVFMFLLVGFVFLCWMGSYYIFAHPEQAANYRLLTRLRKLDAPQRFEITAAPRGEFLKPGQLLERFNSMTAMEIRRTNENLLRNFVRNYHQTRDLVPYAVGTYRVLGTTPLSGKTFCPLGIVALMQAVEQPEILLEQLFTADVKSIPSLQRALAPGQEIKLEKPLDLSAVVHVDRLPDNRIRLTTMPLLYGSYGSARGQASFSLMPPEALNMEAGLPVLTADQIDGICGGTPSRNTPGGGRLSRIAEESASPASRDPKAPREQTRMEKTALSRTSGSAGETTVARAIPVNAQPVLPAIPVTASTPPPEPAVSPREIATPAPIASPKTPVRTNPAVPAPSVLPKPPEPSPTPPPPLPASAQVAPGAPATPPANQAASGATQDVWPVYSPGQMPRGHLLDPPEVEELAAKGIGGERHYLQGRFLVTASGNGKAVLRPQGALAGVPMGPSSKVRVIVDFPAGGMPPAEGNTVARDNLRPFQITSVKRGEDGQINVYARDVTRGE
jgi:hypothetical protein